MPNLSTVGGATATAFYDTAAGYDLGIVPGVDDTLTIGLGHARELRDARVLGSPTVDTLCLTVNGTLIYANGGTLKRHGRGAIGGSGVLRGRGGGVDELDPGSHGVWPHWTHSTGAQLVIENTTISSAFTARGAAGLTYSATRGSWIRTTGPFNGLEINATGQYLDLLRLGGNRDHPVFYTATQGAAQTHRFGIVRAESCGHLYRSEWSAANKGVRFEGLSVENSWSPASVPCVELPTGANTEVGHARLQRFFTDRQIAYLGAQYVELQEGLVDIRPGAGNAAQHTLACNTASTVALCDLVLSHHGDSGSGAVNVMITHDAAGGGDIAYTRLMAAVRGTNLVIGTVVGSGSTAGTTTLQAHAQSYTGSGHPSDDILGIGGSNTPAARTAVFDRCIVPPDAITRSRQTASVGGYLGNPTNLALVVRHCTFASTTLGETGVKLGETQSTNLPENCVSVFNNLVVDPSETNKAIVVHRIGSQNQQNLVSATALGWNVVVSGFSGNSGIGYVGSNGASFNTGATLRSGTGVLAGVGQQPTTDLQLATVAAVQFKKPFGYSIADLYAERHGTTGSQLTDLDAALAKLRRRNHGDWDPTWTLAGVWDALTDAATPQHPVLFGRVHPTLTPLGRNAPGAVNMVAPVVAVGGAGAAAATGAAGLQARQVATDLTGGGAAVASGAAALQAVQVAVPLPAAGAAQATATGGLTVVADVFAGTCLGVLDVERVTARPWDTVAEIGIPGVIPMLSLAADSDNEIQLSGVKDSGRPAGGLLRPASGLEILARLETLDGLTVAGATDLECVGSAAAAGEWLLRLPAAVMRTLAGSRFTLVFALALGDRALEVAFEVRVQRLGAGSPRGLAGVRAVRARAGRTARPDFTTGAPSPTPPPTAVPLRAAGVSSARAAAALDAGTPPSPVLEVPVTVLRFDGTTAPAIGVVTVSGDLPDSAGLSDAQLLTARLYRAADGVEVPTYAWRLLGARRRIALQYEQVGALAGDEYVVRFGLEGAPRRTPAPTVALPPVLGCERSAAHRCAAELVSGPLTPLATRGALPAGYTVVDDDYARMHAQDVTATDAEYAAWAAAGFPTSGGTHTAVAFQGRGGAATGYDAPATKLAQGARRDGALGLAWMRAGLVQLDRMCRTYYDPNNFGVPEQWHAFTALPAAYWLTGHDTGTTGGPGNAGDGWRRRAAFAVSAGVNHYRQFLYAGDPSVLGTTVSAAAGRPIGNTFRGWALAARLGLSSAAFPGSGGSSAAWTPATIEASVVAFLAHRATAQRGTGGTLQGSWGGTEVVGTTSADPAVQATPWYGPGLPVTVLFQVGYGLQDVYDLEREATVWGAPVTTGTRAALRTLLIESLTYYRPFATPRALAASGSPSGFPYATPIPNTSPPAGEPNSFNDPATGHVLNGFWLAPALRVAQLTGDTTWVTWADRMARDLADGRLPGGVINSDAATWSIARVRKEGDETYHRHHVALALRAAFGAAPLPSPWDAAFSADFGP